MSNSPDRLVTRNEPNNIKTVPKKILFFVIAGSVLLFAVMTNNLLSDEKKEAKQEKPAEIIVENNEQYFPKSQDSGLLSAPEPEPVKEEPAEDFFKNLEAKNAPDPNENVKRFIQLREQKYMEALLSSPTAYKNSYSQISAPNKEPLFSAEKTPLSNTADPKSNQSSNYDVSANIDKEQFFERSKPDNQWINPNIRTAGQKYEIKTGSVIPAAMITAVNSDLPGNMIAQVTQNIYDSATGHYLLIPQGSKLFGVYDSRVIMGQKRVLVAWNRIVFPDGSAMTIPSIPGADMAGNSGFHQKVDNHYFRIFGSSILMALITAGTAYAVDENNNTDNENSLSSQLNSALAQQLGQVTTSILQKNLNISPTLEIDPGYRFIVVLTKDLVFGGIYRGWKQ